MLDKLGLLSLEQRSLRSDLIEVHKIMRGMDKDVNVNTLEEVQRRFTALRPGMRGLSDEEKMDELGLFLLEIVRTADAGESETT
eukprot:g26128.t1